jgi:hypothetical protein
MGNLCPRIGAVAITIHRNTRFECDKCHVRLGRGEELPFEGLEASETALTSSSPRNQWVSAQRAANPATTGVAMLVPESTRQWGSSFQAERTSDPAETKSTGGTAAAPYRESGKFDRIFPQLPRRHRAIRGWTPNGSAAIGIQALITRLQRRMRYPFSRTASSNTLAKSSSRRDPRIPKSEVTAHDIAAGLNRPSDLQNGRLWPMPD